jgi:hypothetical protein
VTSWAYFNAACERYVGQNADEIQADAMQAGALASTASATLLQRTSNRPKHRSRTCWRSVPTSHKAQTATLREKVARARARAKTETEQTTFL